MRLPPVSHEPPLTPTSARVSYRELQLAKYILPDNADITYSWEA